MKSLFLIICLAYASVVLAVNPSQSLGGKVIDVQTRKPVEGAIVVVSSLQPQLSGITDAEGNFKIEKIPAGKHTVTASILGYKKQTASDVTVDTEKPAELTLELESEAKELNEVLVVAESGGAGATDKSVYRISDKLSNIATSGVEVLKYIPSVSVDLQQNVSVGGSGNIQYLIDDRRVSLDEIKALDSRKIAKVEVLHNPSSKYDADVTAVINVILKTNVNFGLSGKVETDTHYADKLMSNNKVNLEYGVKKWRFFADAFYGVIGLDYQTTQTNAKSNGDLISKTGEGRFENVYSNMNVGFDYKINKNNSIYYKFQYKPKVGESIEGDLGTDYFESNIPTAYSSMYSIEKDFNSSYKNYLFYKHKFEKAGHDLSVSVEHSQRIQNVDRTFEEIIFAADRFTQTSPQTIRKYETENNKNNIVANIDYNLPLNEQSSFKFGLSTNSQWFDNVFNQDNSSFAYTEYKTAAYANYSQNWKKWNFQAGVRFENAEVILDDSLNILYYSFLPQASLQYKLSDKQKLKLSYRRSIFRPMVDKMNPFEEWADSLHFSHGNKDLVPAYEDKFELTHQSFVRASVYYRLLSGLVGPTTTLRTDGVYESSFANIDDGSEYGCSLSGAVPLRKWWNLNFSGSLFKQEQYANAAYQIEGRSNWSHRVNGASMFSLPKDFTIALMANYNAPTIDGQTTRCYNAFYGLSIDKRFKSSLNVGLMWINPFASIYNFKNETSYGYNFTNKQKTGAGIGYLINLRVSYTFNKGNKLEKQDKPKDTDEDAGKRMF